ncbi:HAD-IA family hydrolase [Novosphingobium profundi]|uniref:HAD-IA family hydrolase n=1 Tax=Novosphingobium profundi TaxID=1774954 RepID=UPI001CFD4858|nr:HAD-IA family hydrolase [Novosphingobium profundi]
MSLHALSDQPEIGLDIDDPARQLASDFDVISFDVFETLLRRKATFRPVDIFHEIGRRSQAETGLEPFDFATLRVRAERDARNRAIGQGGDEVRLDEIYATLGGLAPTLGYLPLPRPLLERLRDLEIEVELEHLEPIESVQQFYNWAVAQAKTIIFVSDFYAPASMLAKALEKAGYSLEHALFVSSEIGLTKHKGTLYGHVLETIGSDPTRVLHVGDNAWSDGSRALQANIHHLRINNPAGPLSWHLRLADSRPAPRLQSAMMAKVCDDAFGHGLVSKKPNQLPLIERVGRLALGPLLLGLASWLYEEAGKQGFDSHYFCSRDGLVMKRAFDSYQAHFGKRVDTRYLEVSRQVIYRAQAARDVASVKPLFVQNWDQLTPAHALARWGLTPEEFSEEIVRAGFRNQDELVALGDAKGQTQFAQLFDLCRDALAAANRPHAELMGRYLDEAGLNSASSPCLVDIGWHGSMQRGLTKILDRKDLSGRYLGLFAPREEMKAIGAEGYLFSTDGTPLSRELRASPSLVELLHTAGHGSICGYQADPSGHVVATFEERPAEAAQYTATIEGIQTAALDFVDEILGRAGPIAAMIDPATAFAGLGRLLNRPFADEVAKIGALRISANYGALAKSTALTDLSPEGYRLWNYNKQG